MHRPCGWPVFKVRDSCIRRQVGWTCTGGPAATSRRVRSQCRGASTGVRQRLCQQLKGRRGRRQFVAQVWVSFWTVASMLSAVCSTSSM